MHHGDYDGFLLTPLEAVHRADFHGRHGVCSPLLYNMHLQMFPVTILFTCAAASTYVSGRFVGKQRMDSGDALA